MKSFHSINIIILIDAPLAFLIPISLVRCNIANDTNPYNPRHEMNIASGSGISEENIDQVFVPFFTSREDGSGIGLSLSQQIMRLHGGSITVRSEPYKETVFTLLF